jgi:hypothetical protein
MKTKAMFAMVLSRPLLTLLNAITFTRPQDSTAMNIVGRMNYFQTSPAFFLNSTYYSAGQSWFEDIMLENQSSSARQVTCDSAMTAHP